MEHIRGRDVEWKMMCLTSDDTHSCMARRATPFLCVKTTSTPNSFYTNVSVLTCAAFLCSLDLSLIGRRSRCQGCRQGSRDQATRVVPQLRLQAVINTSSLPNSHHQDMHLELHASPPRLTGLYRPHYRGVARQTICW